MIREKFVHKQARDELVGAAILASLSDQLTISSRLIQRGPQPDYPSRSIAAEDRPSNAFEVECPWLPFVLAQLEVIAGLPQGWDSHSGRSPDAHLVASARGLIECLAQVANLPQPHVNPTRNGGVQFEWEAGKRYFELEIVAERAAEYIYCDYAAHVEETGSVFEEESLEPVLAHIRSVGPPQ